MLYFSDNQEDTENCNVSRCKVTFFSIRTQAQIHSFLNESGLLPSKYRGQLTVLTQEDDMCHDAGACRCSPCFLFQRWFCQLSQHFLLAFHLLPLLHPPLCYFTVIQQVLMFLPQRGLLQSSSDNSQPLGKNKMGYALSLWQTTAV